MSYLVASKTLHNLSAFAIRMVLRHLVLTTNGSTGDHGAYILLAMFGLFLITKSSLRANISA